MSDTLRVILGDQLSHSISSLRDATPGRDVILMCEVDDEATYVRHHPKKIVLVLAAMRHFAGELAKRGYTVRYVRLDDPGNTGSIAGEVARATRALAIDRIIVTRPGEHRVLESMSTWQSRLDVNVDLRDDDRFLVDLAWFDTWANKRESLRMEHFYRQVRKRLGILMDGDQPAGGRWNFDADNRRRLPPDIAPPRPPSFKPDAITRKVISLVKRRFPDHFGEIEPFGLAVTRKQALATLDDFVANRLPRFGDFQDAMKQGEPALFHSLLSTSLNIGLLEPAEVVEAAESAFRAGHASINSVEGFIRQVAGWREYVRGVYWLAMPGYRDRNALDARRHLPGLYWGGETRMNCLAQCVDETRRNAYAHHIQRLMVLGNFALLCGIDPVEVNEWYLAVYADAFEWVELPNVTGMVLFADDGFLASKPYAAGGAYINRMSDYCRACHYKVDRKNGDAACPFNYLYWSFLDRHRDKLRGNQRLAMPYRSLERMSNDKLGAIRHDSREFLTRLDAGAVV